MAWPEEQYQEFAAVYGFDVRTWAGYPVLREIRELTMTTWIMQNVGESRRPPPSSPCESPHCGKEISSVPGTSSDQPASSPGQPAGPATAILRSAKDPGYQPVRHALAPGGRRRRRRAARLPAAVAVRAVLPAVRRPATASLMPRGAGCRHAEVPALAACRDGDRRADLAVPPAVGADRRGAEPGRALRAGSTRSTCSRTATSATCGSARPRPRSTRTPWPSSSAPMAAPNTVSCPSATRSCSAQIPRPRTARTWSSG